MNQIVSEAREGEKSWQAVPRYSLGLLGEQNDTNTKYNHKHARHSTVERTDKFNN